MNNATTASQTPPLDSVPLHPIVRPRVGQVWSFRGGRHDKIKRVSRAGWGKWGYRNGKIVPLQRKTTAMWVAWESGMMTITAKALWKDWVYVA
jgi:hypothetical protein